MTKGHIREKRKTNRGTVCANQFNKQSPPPPAPGFPPPPRRPLCYSCPAFFVDVKDNPPTNTARLSLISSRYAAEVEIYGPFFCYPEHKSCIRIKVVSLSRFRILFSQLQIPQIYVERYHRQTTTITSPQHAPNLTMTR